MNKGFAKRSYQRKARNYTEHIEKEKVPFHIEMMPHFMDGVRVRDFINKLGSWKECARLEYELFIKIFPSIRRNFKDIFSGKTYGKYKHCRKIHLDKNQRRIHLISKICDKMYGFNVLNEMSSDSTDLWELGFNFNLSIRIFGLYDRENNVFNPLICDWYHFIFPPSKPIHNKKDEKNNKINPGVFRKDI